MLGGFKVFSGNSNRALAEKVCSHLNVSLGEALVGQFSDGEVRVEVQENVRGMDVFVIQSTCAPINQNLIELLVMIDALKRSSASKVTAVIPYYGYARQDQKIQPRVAVAAKVVANMLGAAGVDRIVAIDLHAGQIEGFFTIPVENLSGLKVLLNDARERLVNGGVVVAPDAAGVRRARAFAAALNMDLAIMDYRDFPFEDRSRVVGTVKGRPVVVVDDMINTGNTFMRALEAARASGAASVEGYCIHPVLSAESFNRLENSHFEAVTVTDTIPQVEKFSKSKKFRVVTVSDMLAEAILRIHEEKSISSDFLISSGA